MKLKKLLILRRDVVFPTTQSRGFCLDGKCVCQVMIVKSISDDEFHIERSISTVSGLHSRRPQPSATIGVRGCRLPALTKAYKTLRGSLDRQLRPGTQATAICYYRRSKLPFARPQRPKTLRGSFDRQLLPGTQATAICYYRHLSVFEAAVCAPSNLKPSAAASTGSFDQAQPSAAIAAFEAAVCPPSKA